jgi:hypothetical protein
MRVSRFRKVAIAGGAGLVALTFSLPVFATAARVKGKFKPADSGSVVLGSAKVKPLSGGVQRVGLTLQHVWVDDYAVYLGTFTDANGDGQPQAAELAVTAVPGCDLSMPTKKGHDGCVGDATLAVQPNIVLLAVPGAGGPSYVAWAHLK